MGLDSDGSMAGGKCPKCSRTNFLDELQKGILTRQYDDVIVSSISSVTKMMI